MPRRSIDLLAQPPLDAWLRFSPSVQAYHDRETGALRTAELRSAIITGLLFYNVYNLSSIVLLPDIFWLSVLLRVAVVTPTSLGLYWLIGRIPPAATEWIVTLGTVGAYAAPLFLFWLTQAPLGLYTFGELPLTILFATMLLALRFTRAVIFTLTVLGLSLLAVVTKPGLDPGLASAFALQIVTAGMFGLYANYRLERRRCADFLATLMASIIADSAEAARRQFQDLSQTDALTQLPNRRALTQHLEEWHAGGERISVLMVDVDHFKIYNDMLGHLAGDRCLRLVADALAAVSKLSGRGICARFGGEEFVIALRDADEAAATALAQALIEAVRALDLPHPGTRSAQGRVSVSVGVASSERAAGAEPMHLLGRADRALYAAKTAGRNRFKLAEELEMAHAG